MHTLHPSDVTKLCKQPADYCTELGPDVTSWPTTQPLPTLPGANEAASKVSEAVKAAHETDVTAIREALVLIDQETYQKWFIVHAQNAFHFRVKAFHPKPVVTLAKSERDRPYPLARMERDVFERDGGCCQYCGIAVHLAKDLRGVSALAPDLFPMGRTNLDRAGAMILTRSSADHIIPVSQGGKTVPANLVTACWPCQFGKNAYTPEQLGMTSPLDNVPGI